MGYNKTNEDNIGLWTERNPYYISAYADLYFNYTYPSNNNGYSSVLEREKETNTKLKY